MNPTDPETTPHKPLGLTENGPVLRVELPDDTLNTGLMDELTAVLEGLRDRPDIAVVVLSSAAGDFCLGADRTEYQQAVAADPRGAAMRRLADRAHRLCQALEDAPAVTVARLHGKVVGAGLALAAYCDLRAGADTCTFRMPEIGLGLPPAWGGAMGRLVAEAGVSRIRELMLTCEVFDADTAHRLGLLHKVAPLDRLDAVVDAWTRPLGRRSREALVLTKRMLNGYAKAARAADPALLDAHLLTAQLTAAQRS